MRHGFIGYGNLARAIHQGLADQPGHTFGYVTKDPAPAPRFPARRVGTIAELVRDADALWLCVKPQDLPEVLSELAGALPAPGTATTPGALPATGTPAVESPSLDSLPAPQVVVSPAAGTPMAAISGVLGPHVPVLRIMPNLATAFRQSVTAYCRSLPDPAPYAPVVDDLRTLGMVVELPERHFDLFTAVFGSGPGFLLLIVSVLKERIAEFGLEEAEAEALLNQLLIGTHAYNLHHADRTIEERIRSVASRGGTTEAGMRHYLEHGTDRQLADMITAAERRSKELSRSEF